MFPNPPEKQAPLQTGDPVQTNDPCGDGCHATRESAWRTRAAPVRTPAAVALIVTEVKEEGHICAQEGLCKLGNRSSSAFNGYSSKLVILGRTADARAEDHNTGGASCVVRADETRGDFRS